MKLLLALLVFSNALCSQTWLQLADFPGAECDDGLAVNLNNLLYFGTGLKADWSYSKDFYTLDPATNNWSSIAPMPDGAQRQYACAFAAQGCFFVFGGDGVGGPLNNLYKYTAASNSWQAMAPKPGAGLFGASCLELGDKIIIAGGKTQGSLPASSEVWEYTISTNTWQQKNNFPFGGRFRASSAVLNGAAYLMFGIDDNNIFRREMYSYNAANDSWSKLLDFPQTNGRAYAAMKAIDNKLILFGGYDSTNTYHTDVWFYNPVNNAWAQSSSFTSFGRKGGMSAVAGNKFYYSGGINQSDTRLKETWLLDMPLGIAAYANKNDVRVYPNPIKEIMYFEWQPPQYGNIKFEFTDMYGQTALSINTWNPGPVAALNTSNLLPGVYVLSAYRNAQLLATKRVVKD